MKTTANHGFYQPEHGDDILDTITKLSENFEKADKLSEESTNSLTTFLKSGVEYRIGKKVWNTIPVIGGSVGWVNVRTGKYSPTWQKSTLYSIGDIVSPQNNNGHYYQCIENGISGLNEPVFPTQNGVSVFDTTGGSVWISNYVYNLNDLVFANIGDQLYYYKCINGGTSGSTSPTWSQTSGTTVTDGSVQWQTYKSVKWKEVGVSCEFREFGKIL